jgi:hypothetical protein
MIKPKITGLNFRINEDKNLEISGVDESVTKFSATARSYIRHIVNDTKYNINVRNYKDKNELLGGGETLKDRDVQLDPSKIQDRINAMKKAGFGELVWGFGFWFIHETLHTKSGTSFYDKDFKKTLDDREPIGDDGKDMTVKPGSVETKVNQMREELGLGTRVGYAWYDHGQGDKKSYYIQWKKPGETEATAVKHNPLPDADKASQRTLVVIRVLVGL